MDDLRWVDCNDPRREYFTGLYDEQIEIYHPIEGKLADFRRKIKYGTVLGTQIISIYPGFENRVTKLILARHTFGGSNVFWQARKFLDKCEIDHPTFYLMGLNYLEAKWNRYVRISEV